MVWASVGCRGHARQCTDVQTQPGKGNERGKWFESTSKALSQTLHPNPTQKVSGNLGRKLVGWYLWEKSLWEQDYHAALSVRINPPNQRLTAREETATFSEKRVSLQLCDMSQRGWHAADLFENPKCGNESQPENMSFTFKFGKQAGQSSPIIYHPRY